MYKSNNHPNDVAFQTSCCHNFHNLTPSLGVRVLVSETSPGPGSYGSCVTEISDIVMMSAPASYQIMNGHNQVGLERGRNWLSIKLKFQSKSLLQVMPQNSEYFYFINLSSLATTYRYISHLLSV